MAPARRAGAVPEVPKATWGRPQRAETAWHRHPRHTTSNPNINVPPPTSGEARGGAGGARSASDYVFKRSCATTICKEPMNFGMSRNESAKRNGEGPVVGEEMGRRSKKPYIKKRDR